MSSDCEIVSECEVDYQTDNEKPSTSKNIKHRKQKFRAEWLERDDFKLWLTSDSGNCFMAKCSICKTVITAELSAIKAHSKTSKHAKNMTGKYIYF